MPPTTTCFICDFSASDGQTNFTQIKSLHSGYPLLIFIRKFLRKSILGRDISDSLNCICCKCLIRINEYDEICVKAKRIEDELHRMLLKSDQTWQKRMQSDEGFNDQNIKSNGNDIANESIGDYEDEDEDEENYSSHSISSEKGANIRRHITFECDECGEQFRFKQVYKIHLKSHLKPDQPNFKCALCATVCKDANEYETHCEQHKGLSPLQCIECKKEFKTKTYLAQHMDSKHYGKTNIQCEICGKMLSSSFSFRCHMNVHNDVRNAKCHICSRAFRSKAKLKTHLSTHTGEKPFPCHVCGKAFSRGSNRDVHEKLHGEGGRNSINIYKCTFCQSSFARKAKLTDHMQKNHDTVIPHTTIENQLDGNEVKARSFGDSVCYE